MTVKQMITELKKYPDNMDVFLAERQTEFSFGLAGSVGSQGIIFYADGIEKEDCPEIECVVISED